MFYFSIFPTAFFMGEVYTEGLFGGLFFLTLFLTVKKKRLLAAIFASFLFLTRPIGIIVLVFMFFEWFDFKNFFRKEGFFGVLKNYLVILIPVFVFILWRFSFLGYRFEFVQHAFFGRQGINIFDSLKNWFDAFKLLVSGGNMPTRIYYGIEFSIIFLAIFSFFVEGGKFFSLTILGFSMFVFSFFSGVAQGMHRYLLFIPTLFTMLVKIGENEIFDKTWSIISILFFGLLSLLFSFDMWVG